jgi:hypothetical protein
MDTIIKQFLNNNNINHTFRINPYIINNNKYGKIHIDSDIVNNIKNKLKNKQHKNINKTIHIYRNLYYNLEMNTVIQKNIIDVINSKFGLIVISKDKKLDNDSFPLINKYHNETNMNILSYKFNYVTLSIINELDKFYYIEIQFKYNNHSISKIIDDLNFIYSKIIQN